MAEVNRQRATEADMRAFARADARAILERPISDWGGMDYAFFNSARPYALDEALTEAFEVGHKEGIGAIAVAAYMRGSDASRPGLYQDMEAASQYAAVIDRITPEHGV